MIYSLNFKHKNRENEWSYCDAVFGIVKRRKRTTDTIFAEITYFGTLFRPENGFKVQIACLVGLFRS